MRLCSPLDRVSKPRFRRSPARSAATAGYGPASSDCAGAILRPFQRVAPNGRAIAVNLRSGTAPRQESCVASLELNGVRKSFGAIPVLDDVSLSLEAREFIAFLGPSGSGKSTLLRIIAGLERADAGEVWLEGRRIDQLPPGERGVAMVFQHYALIRT